MATHSQQINDADANCLVIDEVDRQDVIKRIEKLLLYYMQNDFTINQYRMDRKNCLFDSNGAIRIDKSSISVSELNTNKSRRHCAIWKVMSTIYGRLKGDKFYTMKNRGLYYQLLEKHKLFASQNEVDKMVLSLVFIHIRFHPQ